MRSFARRDARRQSAWGLLLASSAVVLMQPLTALACSGPGAERAIAESFRIGLISLALTVGWFLAALIVPPLRRRVGYKGVLLLAIPCVGHPVIWMSRMSGDCGYTMRWASLLVLPVLAVILGALLRPRPKSM